ncbi:hypothetical protein [Streptomyces sp. NPDC051665]|uniref:hypothetical protein n=1 Tax=Streptomyces sp. NPDC051665 TaxID=3154647 RepID=UPI00344891A1
MKAHTSPAGLALFLIVLGLLASFTGLTAAFVTHLHVCRYLIAAGCLVQFAGWVRYAKRSKGGTS